MADGRLVGVITIDDAMVVLDEEYEEDMLRLAGVSDESSLSDSVAATSRRRLPWLGVNSDCRDLWFPRHFAVRGRD